MPPPRLHQSLLGAALYLLVAIVAGRRGGGGSFDAFDTNSGGSSGGSSSSSGEDTCVEPYLLYHDTAPSPSGNEAEGAYYLGKASTSFTLDDGQGNILEDGGICGSKTTPTRPPVQMLGAAWLGPQFRDIEGLNNKFVLGFGAWLPDRPEDIDDPEGVCWDRSNTILFRTTSILDEANGQEISEALDVAPLTISRTNESSTVHFEGTYEGIPGEGVGRFLPGNGGSGYWDAGAFRIFPPVPCAEGPGYDTWFPKATVINGSIAPETVSLTVKGVLPVSVRHQTFISFTVDFQGTFDPVNSTRSVTIGNNNDIVFEGTGAGRVMPAAVLISLVVATGVLGLGYF